MNSDGALDTVDISFSGCSKLWLGHFTCLYKEAWIQDALVVSQAGFQQPMATRFACSQCHAALKSIAFNCWHRAFASEQCYPLVHRNWLFLLCTIVMMRASLLRMQFRNDLELTNVSRTTLWLIYINTDDSHGTLQLIRPSSVTTVKLWPFCLPRALIQKIHFHLHILSVSLKRSTLFQFTEGLVLYKTWYVGLFATENIQNSPPSFWIHFLFVFLLEGSLVLRFQDACTCCRHH